MSYIDIEKEIFAKVDKIHELDHQRNPEVIELRKTVHMLLSELVVACDHSLAVSYWEATKIANKMSVDYEEYCDLMSRFRETILSTIEGKVSNVDKLIEDHYKDNRHK